MKKKYYFMSFFVFIPNLIGEILSKEFGQMWGFGEKIKRGAGPIVELSIEEFKPYAYYNNMITK